MMSRMSEQTTPPRGRLSEHVAEELRVLLARRRMSGAELARRTGIKQSTMSRRMTGETPFDTNDLEAIAGVLGIDVADLFPRREKEANQDFDCAPADAPVTLGHFSVDLADRGSPVSKPKPTGRPPGHPKPGPTRPGSPVPARQRRPAPVGR